MLYTTVILALIALCIYIFFAFGLPKIVSLYASGKFKAEVSIGTIDLVRRELRNIRYSKGQAHDIFSRGFRIQVNLFQKRSFLHQLTHNMTTDCSLIYNFCPRDIQVQNLFCTNIVFLFWFWHSKQCLYKKCSEIVFFFCRTRKSINSLLSYCG